MRHHARAQWLLLAVMLALWGGTAVGDEPSRPAAVPRTTAEARGQARLLHEAMHATLHFVHRAYYREDEGLPIPAATLDKVFASLADGEGVALRWLAVNAQAMSTDHEPQNEFEKQAAAALAGGKPEYEAVEGGIYRRAATIALTSDCLKCHLPNRKSTEARLAGLVIAMPVDDSLSKAAAETSK
jgi:hypothetical protein